MARKSPFREHEREELGQVAGCVFDGGFFPPSLNDAHLKWAPMINLFLLAVNRENGTIEHLPLGPGLCNQPDRTMKIFLFLQDIFIRHLNRKIENAVKRGK